MTRILPVLAIALALFAVCSYAGSPVRVSSDVDVASYSESRPVFRFVVMGDNRPRGGADPVTQPEAFLGMIEEINLLDPDFVVIIGDLILGGTPDVDLIHREWDAFDQAIEGFTMPVYLLPGNHDTYNQVSEDIYIERYGKLYYSFDHKGSHFILLDSDKRDSVDNIAGDQLEWLKADLEKNKNADHIVAFLHKPLSDMESNWNDAVHPLLVEYGADAVFAGHRHEYQKLDTRDGIRYIITGGAGAPLRDHELLGGFYHYTFVTVREPEVKLAVVKAGSVKSENYVTAKSKQKVRQVIEPLSVPHTVQISSGAYRGRVTRRVANPFDHMIEGTLSWHLPSDLWDVSPERIDFKLGPGRAGEYTFDLSAEPGALSGPPQFNAIITIDKNRPPLEITWTVVVAGASQIFLLEAPVTIDGVLTDWLPSTTILRLDGDSNVAAGAENWVGPSDMTAAVALAHDNGDVYLMAKVSDDQLVAGDPVNFRTGDAIAFHFSGNPTDREIEPNRVYVRPELDGRDTDVNFKGNLSDAMYGIEVETKSGNWGYNVELLIPKDVADQILRASENGSFRFDVIVIDVDSEQDYSTTSKHTWSGYPVNWQAPETFGELAVVQQPPSSPAPARSGRQPATRRQR